MRPHDLRASLSFAAGRFTGLMLALFEIALLVSSVQLFGVGQAAASAWGWLAALQSPSSR